jgi:hypothetical protein
MSWRLWGQFPGQPGAGGPGARPRPKSSSTGTPTASPIRCGPWARSRLTEPNGPLGSGPARPSSASRPSSGRPPSPAMPGRPAGHPRPPHQRPRPAAGRHRRRSAGGGVAGPGQRGPPRRFHPGDLAGDAVGRVGRLDPLPTLAGGYHPRDRCRWGSPWPPAGARLGLIIAGLAVAAAGWGLRFRPSPDAVAWRRGAAGERRTAGCSTHWSDTGGPSCTTWLSLPPDPQRVQDYATWECMGLPP